MRRAARGRAVVAIAVALAGSAALAEPRFADRAGDLPVTHVYGGGWEHFVGGGVAVFDCNGDARPDFFAAGGSEPSHLFVNRTAAPGAALAFDAAPLDPAGAGVTGAYPLDIDSDGTLDLFVLRVGPNVVLRGRGACRFEDATEAFGIDPGAAWSTSFSATWERGARWPTMVVGNYVDRDAADGPFGACDANRLFRAGPAGYERPVALTPGFCALSMLISDWRRSGRPALRVSNDRHYYVRGGYEQMWELAPLRQLGPADGWDPVSIWGMGIASHDLNGDARPDVVLTSMGDQLMHLSTGASDFTPAPYEIGTYAQRPHLGDDGRPSTGWHAEFGDIDNDGRMDLFIAKGNVDQMPGNAMEDPNNLLLQGPDGRFVERSVEAGVASVDRARGAGLADFDGDGRLDLVVVNRRAPLELWQNLSAGAGNWLAVAPRQDGTNPHAVGAWVEMRGPAGRQSREVTVGGGHAGGQALALHFGLSDAESAEVRVIWPDGTAGAWTRLAAGRTHVLHRADTASH